MKGTDKLSASNIRFLLAIKHFEGMGKKCSCTGLANLLKCKKSSAYNMIMYLCEKNLLVYEGGTGAEFTDEGKRITEEYYLYYRKISRLLNIDGFEIDENCFAVSSFIAEAPVATLKTLIEKS